MLTYIPLTLVRRETIAQDAVVLEFAPPSAEQPDSTSRCAPSSKVRNYDVPIPS